MLTQRIQSYSFMIAATIVALLIVLFVHTLPATAQSAANTLKVSPVRSDIEALPGTSKTVQTTVTNLTNQDITVRPIANDFIAGDQRGTPALILDEDEFAPTRSLKRFMAPLPDVLIPAGQARTINVVINIPETATAGGYFGAVRFAPTTPDSGGQVNLSASVASLILLTVPGDFIEELMLTNFDIQQDGQADTIFENADGLQATFRFQNNGNVQIGPFGQLSVKQGDTVVYKADFNNKEPRDVVLPDSSRVWDIPFENIGDFGYYTVIATFTYGKDNQTIEINKSFWVIPPIAIVIAIVSLVLILGAITFGIWLFLRRRKRTGGGRKGSRKKASPYSRR